MCLPRSHFESITEIFHPKSDIQADAIGVAKIKNDEIAVFKEPNTKEKQKFDYKSWFEDYIILKDPSLDTHSLSNLKFLQLLESDRKELLVFHKAKTLELNNVKPKSNPARIWVFFKKHENDLHMSLMKEIDIDLEGIAGI